MACGNWVGRILGGGLAERSDGELSVHTPLEVIALEGPAPGPVIGGKPDLALSLLQLVYLGKIIYLFGKQNTYLSNANAGNT